LALVLAGGVVARTSQGPVEAVDLVVSGGRVGGERAAAERVDVSGCLVVPGHACSHHHLYSSLARGMPVPEPAPKDFVEILERVWWQLDRALDPETIYLSAAWGALEATRCGTTSIVDHHSSPNAIASCLDAVGDALHEAGLRSVICYEVTDRNGQQQGRAGVEENSRFAASNERPLVRSMMGAHASFTIGSATLEHLIGAARDSALPVHVHLAEDSCDERDSLDRYGVRTAQRLAAAGALEEGDLVAHGVWLDADEIALLRTSGAWLAHNPRSNMNNGVGYAPAQELGPRVALGTDGIDGDLFAEARACYLRGRERSQETAPGWAMERLAAGSALVGASFGEPALGRLEPGAPADLVVLDYGSPTPLHSSNFAGHYLFGLSAAHVRDVMVAGRWVLRDRRSALIDEDGLSARCRAAARRLWDGMRA
jgi:putative selenium metabolism protein SsnA